MNTVVYIKKVRACTAKIKSLESITNKEQFAQEYSEIQSEINSLTQDMTNPSLCCLHDLVDEAKKHDLQVSKIENELI